MTGNVNYPVFGETAYDNSMSKTAAVIVILQSKKRMNTHRKTIQLILATFISVAGLVLIGAGFVVPPVGSIDASVLTAFGEILTFAGALFGMDYHYKNK